MEFSPFTDLLKSDVSSATILHHEFIASGRSFMYIKTKMALVLILVELQALFFSTQMFGHLKQLFALDFQDSYLVAKVAHLQRHKILT